MNERTHVDLFTGIGGFSIAARANGVRTIAMCEADARCQAFLAKAWPGVPVWPDVRTFSLADAERKQGNEEQQRPEATQGKRSANQFSRCGAYSGQVWLLTAGVPCQPASRAGKQGGASDDRWLWPAAVSVFAALRPAWGLFENPPGIGDVGLAGILSDLEAQGYAARVFSVGACALGAPHRRMRYWIVCRRLAVAAQRGQREHGSALRHAGHADEHGQGGVGDTESIGGERRPVPARGPGGAFGGSDRPTAWSNYVWLPCADGKVRRAPDSAVELVDGRPVDIIETLAKEGWPHRSVLGALGNSVVWQIPAMIIAAMIKSENIENNQ
jgi:DNA (cytosine-5)-methyltransferase 1